MSADNSTLQDDPGRTGPGSQLRIARESKRISLEDIAARTHISVSRLQALEENRFDILGPEPFVIGYIRKFAKIVDVESDPLVEEYKNLRGFGEVFSASPGAHAGKTASTPGPAAIAGRNLAQAVRSISGWWIVGGLVVAWIAGAHFLVPGDSESRPAIRETLREQAESEISRPVDDTTRETHTAQENGIARDSSGTVATESGPALGENAVPIDQSADTAEAVSAREEEAAHQERTGPEIADVRETDSETQPPVAEAGQGEERDLLVMSFADSCWVEVRDADDQVIFAKLQTPDDTLELFGKSPFTVMLGNARVVSLAINGRPVDTQPRPGRDTLRLTVSP